MELHVTVLVTGEYAIEHKNMQMKIKIDGSTESLRKGDCPALCSFEPNAALLLTRDSLDEDSAERGEDIGLERGQTHFGKVSEGAGATAGPRLNFLHSFTLKGAEGVELLHARRLAGRLFLVTVEGGTRIEVKSTPEFPFEKVANDSRVAFAKSDGTWSLVVRDPRLEADEAS